MTGAKFEELFGGAARKHDELLEQRHMDLAASVQAVTEEIVLRLARTIARETGEENLCLAGGVALNCVANGKLLRSKSFKELFVQPAAGDAGGALGAALATYHHHEGGARVLTGRRDAMKGSYLGPEYDQSETERRLKDVHARFTVVDDNVLIEETAKALASQQAVGWRQGRLEFGPRALGAASILADPRSPTMQKNLNLKVKFRESFRPFAPSVIRERIAEWFELDAEFAVYAACGGCAKEPAAGHDPWRAGFVRHRKAECLAVRDPCGHSCGLFGSNSDCSRRHQP